MGLEVQLIVASFIAGVLTILAPCVIPVLPIIVGGSANDAKSKYKPLVITASLIVSVVIFTFLLQASTALIDIPNEVWTYFAGLILITFGLFSIFPKAWDWLSLKAGFSSKSNQLLAKSAKRSGLYGDALIGFSLGPVFSSCSPTYAVIVGIVLGGEFATGTIYLLFYALGLGIMMLGVAYAGQRLVAKLGWATDPEGLFKKILGIIFIIIGLSIMTGFDKTIITWLLDGGLYDWRTNIEIWLGGRGGPA